MSRNDDGLVIVGKVTRKACDLAIDIASKKPDDYTIITPAGRADAGWSRAWMGQVMADYIKKQASQLIVHPLDASDFNTYGELNSFVYFARHRHITHRDVDELIITVKHWHAPRASFICSSLMQYYRMHFVPLHIHTYEHKVGTSVLFKEYCAAWPKAIIKSFLPVPTP